MNRFMSTLFLALLILIVNMNYTRTIAKLTCDELPKVKFPENKVLVANSPFIYDYTATPWFDCSRNINLNPARGTGDHHGAAVVIKGFTVTVFQYIFGPYGLLGDTVCSTGEKIIWHSQASQFDHNGGFLCMYSCHGKTLREYICFSNNNGTSPKELEAVEMARRVPNGYLIHDAWENCPVSKGCNPF